MAEPTIAELQQQNAELQTKVKEFRDTNNRLTKENDGYKTRFDGIDPDVVKADRAKLIELEKAKPHERISALERNSPPR